MTTFFGIMVFKKNWIYINLKYLYVDIVNPKKTMNKLKGIFKPLKCCFKHGKNLSTSHLLWVSKPHLIQIVIHDVGWKDKYDTPRFECSPYIWIHIFKWDLIWCWSLPLHQKHREDEYWEQALWYLYYNKTISQGLNNYPDIKVAKESWLWQDMNGNSTWTDEFLVK